MLRAAGRCPTAHRRFGARNSRMVLAELVLCESRGPVSFIKHLFIFGLFQYAEGWISRPLPMQIRIGGNGRVATTSVQTRRHATLLSKRGAFTNGICEASLSLESQADSLTGGQDYKLAQRHFVNIFSAQENGRFNSRPIGRETSEKEQSQPENPISYRRR